MFNQEDLSQIESLLGPSQRVLILTGEKPTPDSLGASLALYLALLRLGKTASIACPDLPTVGLSRLVGVDRVQNDLGGQNLVIAFPYTEGSIEKVSYNIEGDKFNLVIQPRPGVQPLSSQNIQFSRGGADADLIFILGTSDWSGLGKLYEKDKALYEKVPVVAIDHQVQNIHYGKINLVLPSASSTSEIIGLLLGKLGIDWDLDIAQNLLAGIDFATQNFSSPRTSVEAFEIAASCLKLGAKRQTSVTVEEKQPSVKPRTKSPFQPMVKDVGPNEAPSDWLTPKIFKGSNLP